MTADRRHSKGRRVLVAGATLVALLVAFGLGVMASDRLRARLDEWGLFVKTSMGPSPYQGYMRQGELPTTRGAAEGELSEEQRREIEALQSMAYLSGTNPPTDAVGVTVHVAEMAQPGVNLVVDTHAPEAVLMDMDGNALHRWRYDWKRAFPESTIRPGAEGIQYWRRVALLEDGGLLAIFEGAGLVRLDVDSRLLWGFEEAAHHDLEVQEDGRIVLLTREASVRPEIHAERPITEDWIVVLSSDGVVERRVSILDAILRSDYHGLIALTEGEGDLLHTNTVEILDGRLADVVEGFRAGNALLSFPKINTVAVLDMESEEIVWAMVGLTSYQHEPTVLDNGRLMLLYNWNDQGPTPGGETAYSRILEIDPVSRRIEWSYDGSTYDFFTRCCGTNQRLANGNTLITETDRGRAFEVTPDRKIVWEFLTPHRVGEGDDELVARLFEVLRLDRAYVEPWLASR